MNQNILRRIGFIVLLYIAAAGILLALVRDPAGFYPEMTVESRDDFELHGMIPKHKSWLRATEADPHVILNDVNRRVRVLELDIPKKKYKRSTDVTMKLFYDTGEGFSAEQSVCAVMKKGTTRFWLPEGTYVTRLRLDFYDIPGNSVKFASLRINPKDLTYPNALPLALFAAVLCFLVLLLALYAPRREFLLEAAAAVFLILASGVPVLRCAKAAIRLPAFAITFSAFWLASVLILQKGKARERLFLLFLLVTAGLLSFYWIFMAPGGEGPDEGMRLVVVEYIHRHGTLPRGDDPEIRDVIWGFSYAYYPILPYMVSGCLARLLELLPGIAFGEGAMLKLARCVNGTAYLVTIAFVFRLAGKLFPQSMLRFTLPAAAAFFPQFLFIGTYVNTDCFAMLSSAVILYYWARGTESGWKRADAVGLSVGLSLCALSYYYYYGFILMSVPFVFFSAKKAGKDGRGIFHLALFITLLTFALAGWWFIRNLILYDGDLFARATLNKNAELYAQDYYKPSNIPNPRAEGQSLVFMLIARGWIRQTLQSFVAVFSNLTLYARPHVFVLYGIAAAAGLAGLVFRMLLPGRRRGGSGDDTENSGRSASAGTETLTFGLPGLMLLCAMVIPIVLSCYYSYTADFQPQGRYALGALIPLLIFLGRGFEAIEGRLRRIPVGTVLALGTCFVTVNLFLDTVCTAYLR